MGLKRGKMLAKNCLETSSYIMKLLNAVQRYNNHGKSKSIFKDLAKKYILYVNDNKNIH